MVTKQNDSVGWHEVFIVVVFNRRRQAVAIKRQHRACDIKAVIAISDGVKADCGDYQPRRADSFSVKNRDDSQRDRPQNRNQRKSHFLKH